MKRIVVCLMIATGMTVGAIGCTEKTQVQKTTKVETPEGTNTKTTTIEEKKTGENPPPNP